MCLIIQCIALSLIIYKLFAQLDPILTIQLGMIYKLFVAMCQCCILVDGNAHSIRKPDQDEYYGVDVNETNPSSHFPLHFGTSRALR